MKRNVVSMFATLTLLVFVSAFAWIDLGVENLASAQSQALSFEQEMRDLRRIVMLDRAALARREGLALTLEQEMQDLRRASARERSAVEQREGLMLTLEQEMRHLRAEFRASQNRGAPDASRVAEALQNPHD